MVHQLCHALTPQQRLVTDLEQHPVTVPQSRQAQFDGVADAVIRVGIVDGGEVELPGQPHDLRVLSHHHDFVKLLGRDGFQRPEDETPAPQLGGQLISPNRRALPAAMTTQPIFGLFSTSITSFYQ